MTFLVCLCRESFSNMLSQRHYVVTFLLVYLHRESMEENGDQSYLCW